MELLGDCIEHVLKFLNNEDIINLKKSGIIDWFPNNKLQKILSKKYLDKMIKQYGENEYPNEDIYSNDILSRISRFCFSSMLSEFCYDIDLSTEQIYRMVSILRFEQLEKANNHLNNNKSWY